VSVFSGIVSTGDFSQDFFYLIPVLAEPQEHPVSYYQRGGCQPAVFFREFIPRSFIGSDILIRERNSPC
jgi:hypothetical protein